MLLLSCPIMSLWRFLHTGEKFRYNYADPMDVPNSWVPGYVCFVKVMLHGHGNCSCLRSTSPTIRRVFRPHTAADGSFPVWHTVSDGWLRDASTGGFDIPDHERPGFIAAPATHISYGFLTSRMVYEDEL